MKSFSFELNNTWVSVSRYWWAARRIYKFARILNRIESPRRHKKLWEKCIMERKKRRKGEFKHDAKHFHNNCSRSCLRNRQKRSTQKHFSASIPTTVERGKKRGIFTFLFLLGVLNKRPTTERMEGIENCVYFTKRWNAAASLERGANVHFRYIEEEMVKKERHVYV